jgi:D-serine deaminase-like pyridoxal phosphate-dependent protein
MAKARSAVPKCMIIDGGSKTFSFDRPVGTNTITFGHMLETSDSLFSQMNEEHGFIDIRDTGRKFAIGDRVRIIPNHICPAVNLHEQIYGIRNGKVEQVWQVEGRGKLQ